MREIRRLLLRRLWLLPLLTILGGVIGAAYAALQTPTFTATAYVVATANEGDSIGALNFAQAYGRVATSGPVLAKAGVLLGAGRRQFDSVTASTSPDAPVVEIRATEQSAQRAADVANAAAEALVAYGVARRSDTHVGLAVLAGAVTPAEPSSPSPPLELIVGAAGGLLIGGLTVLARVGRPEQRSPERPAEPGGTSQEPVAWTAEVGRPAFEAPTAFEAPAIEKQAALKEPAAIEKQAAVGEREPAGKKAINGAIYQPGPAIGRVAVSGMGDDDD
jgi:capsular polysaccharide biosynthesis protein